MRIPTPRGRPRLERGWSLCHKRQVTDRTPEGTYRRHCPVSCLSANPRTGDPVPLVRASVRKLPFGIRGNLAGYGVLARQSVAERPSGKARSRVPGTPWSRSWAARYRWTRRAGAFTCNCRAKVAWKCRWSPKVCAKPGAAPLVVRLSAHAHVPASPAHAQACDERLVEDLPKGFFTTRTP